MPTPAVAAGAVRPAAAHTRRAARTAASQGAASRGVYRNGALFKTQLGQLGWARLSLRTRAADAAMGGSADFGGSGGSSPKEEEAAGEFKVFPRLKERDPYRKLGITREASFEEIQSARDFLVEQYRWHEASRESIELSYEKILNEKMNLRHKYGFKPPTTGKKGEMQGDPEPTTLFSSMKEAVEPDVPLTTIVNEGIIYLGLAIWAAIQSASADPVLPLGLAFGYAAYKIFDKRTKRSPDGPYWGNSPIWGALGSALMGMLAGVAIGWLLARYVPFPAFIQPASVSVGLIIAMCGVAAICFK